MTELDTADDALREARALLDLALLMGALSRLYYAAFHAARAVLLARGRHAKTHSGQVTLFNAEIGSTPLLARLLDMRIDADYRPERFAQTEPAVRIMLGEATAFVERCRVLVAEEVARGVDDPDPPPDL